MGCGGSRRGLGAATAVVALAVAAFSLAGWAAPPQAAAAHFASKVSPQYDRTAKCDLVDRLPRPPELVIFGGSRAQRFEPSVAERLTGLEAFNFAVQNSRPEDVYAMTRYLFWRAPKMRVRCFWALQATTISDSPLHPGLLVERRLNQFLPKRLVTRQRVSLKDTAGRQLSADTRFSARGSIVRNKYDARVERGVTLERALARYLASMVPRAASPSPYTRTRARAYFERTLELFNRHDVEPVLVIMPYHPTALAAFRAAGWGAKEAELKSYLESLRGRYRFRLLDYTDIRSFHGLEEAFYDGAHVTAANARRILARAVADAPDAFR
ncbi:MAG: hypothetical protein GX624_02615 [Actinobacteria bacterium]|nr:hypothetical protein [Actinomycetota bacterium]